MFLPRVQRQERTRSVSPRTLSRNLIIKGVAPEAQALAVNGKRASGPIDLTLHGQAMLARTKSLPHHPPKPPTVPKPATVCHLL